MVISCTLMRGTFLWYICICFTDKKYKYKDALQIFKTSKVLPLSSKKTNYTMFLKDSQTKKKLF